MNKTLLYNNIFYVNFLSIFIGLINLNSISNEIVIIPLITIIAFQFIMIFNKKSVIELKYDKEKVIFSIILCLLFLLELPINCCLKQINIINNNIIVNYIGKFFFLESSIVSIFFILCLIFSFKCFDKDNIIKEQKIIKIIIFVISLVFISTTSTGFFDWDFSGIWQQDQTGWGNWHTFAFGFLVYISKKILNTPYLIILLNFILYISFFYYAINILSRNFKSKKLLIIFFVLTCLTIVGFDQIRYVKKDVIFALGFCNLILTTYDYLSLNKFTMKHFINYVIYSSIVVLFRHGGLYLIIFIYLILFIYSILQKKFFELKFYLFALIIVLFINNSVNYYGFNKLGGYSYPDNVKYTVPIYQVGSFASINYSFKESDANYIEKYLPIEYMAKNFKKYNADILTRSWNIPEELQVNDSFNYSRFLNVNYNMFVDKPVYYVKSLLDLTNVLWKFVPNDEELFFYFVKWDESSNIVMYKETKLNKYVDFIVNVFLKSFLYNLRIRGAFPLFLFIFSASILIYKKKYKYLIPIFFILFWYICLFLSLPISLTRYCLPFINICYFILIFCIGINDESIKKY